MDTAVDVQLLTHTPDPIRVMYVAFRTCYSKFPELAKPVKPKCGDQRMGYCDEPLAEYLKCPLGARRIRLHKDEIVAAAKTGRTLESTPLTEDDLALLTPRPEFEKVPAGSPS